MSDDYAEYITRLNQQAVQMYGQGRYEQAVIAATQACDLARQHLAEDHPLFSASLSNLGAIYEAIGEYALAETLHRQALDIRRAIFGENHPDVANSLHNLAAVYDAMGNYAAAEPLYQEALRTRRAVLGERHPKFINTLSNLGALYYSMGNYLAAEPLLRRALEIRRSVLQQNHPDIALSLNNLALLYADMGSYAAAEPLYREAIEIRRVALGENHPYYAATLNNLAALYYAIGDYTAAEPLYQEALRVRRLMFGENNADVAQSLNNLAALYCAMGNRAAAAPLYQQALAIRRVVVGERHPHFAQSLNNLAELYRSLGNFAGAEPLYRQAMEIWRTALGEDHPEYAISLQNLAILLAASGRATEGLALMEKAAAIDDRMLGQVFSIGSETQRTAFLKTLQRSLDVLLSLVRWQFDSSLRGVLTAFEVVLRRKAVGAEALAARRDAVLGGTHPALEPKLRQLATLRMQIAQKTLSGPGPEGLQQHRQQLAGWNDAKERLEAELARQIPEMNLDKKLHAADHRAVAMGLPEGVALVEFVRFNVFDFTAVRARGESPWKPPRYLAFVLWAGDPENVQMIDLGEAEPIDRMTADFRAGVTGEGERGLGAAQLVASEDGLDRAGAVLRAAVFDPLVEALGDRRRLLLASDGTLTRLPFEVLPISRGKRLIDDYQISYVAVGRDVLRFGKQANRQPTAPVVAADPDFDLGADGGRPGQTPSRPVSRCSRDLNRDTRFDRLPGTRGEGQHIADMLGVRPWLADCALEARLKQIRSPRILHLATHGFFLEDQERDQDSLTCELGMFGGQEGLGGTRLENPMLRSGLVLAGVNTWLQGGQPPTQAEDGLLTAEDVTGLDLLDTELVVLSACETGLGEVQIGEGVMGLRRSFALAGARTLVMSLWRVPDQQTQELMEDFYRRILSGQPRAEALREAQLAIRARYPHPFYWGAFICQGEPGPLHT